MEGGTQQSGAAFVLSVVVHHKYYPNPSRLLPRVSRGSSRLLKLSLTKAINSEPICLVFFLLIERKSTVLVLFSVKVTLIAFNGGERVIRFNHRPGHENP